MTMAWANAYRARARSGSPPTADDRRGRTFLGAGHEPLARQPALEHQPVQVGVLEREGAVGEGAEHAQLEQEADQQGEGFQGFHGGSGQPPNSSRAREIVAAAFELLEAEGSVSMRRLADRLGIKAPRSPSTYATRANSRRR
jgi:hypothetical protein